MITVETLYSRRESQQSSGHRAPGRFDHKQGDSAQIYSFESYESRAVEKLCLLK